jgi:uncharacterized surface protein with fasciclin (FAS1) repeats
MLRTKLLTAVAATALLAAPAAFAQVAPQPAAPMPASPPASAAPANPSPAAPPQAAPAPVAEAAPAPAAQPNNVIDVLIAQGNFTTLLSAIDSAGLTETLRTRPAVSIFAPTDEAFAALPEAERTRLMDPANAAELRSLLLYHVIVADVSSTQIQGARGGVETAGRTQVLLDGTGEALKIDGATITRADIDASNGAVFAIDKVLNPARSMAAMGDEEAAPAPAAPAADDAAASSDEAAADAPAEASTPPLPATEAPSPADAPSPATANPAPNPAAITETVRPASPGATAPDGQPSAMTTTVQSPPVANPTDGQVDDEEDPANPAPTPTPN